MSSNRQGFDYEPVAPSRRAAGRREESARDPDWSWRRGGESGLTRGSEEDFVSDAGAPPVAKRDASILKRGHTISYLGLFLFTAALYFRPYELFPSLSAFSSIAFWLAIFTLVAFVPSQLAIEGTPTARPREVNLVLLLCLTALLSMPLAASPGEAWATFTDIFIKVVLMFIVTVNVVRTERRLKALFYLALAVSCVLSVSALNDYRLGRFTVEGYRVAGNIGGMFGNPNDMALHLTTTTPIAVALLLSTRNLLAKMLYGTCAVLVVAGNVVTFSRGGFLGLACAAAVLMWKLGRRNRAGVAVLGLVIFALFVALAPGNFMGRVASIFDPSLDPTGSANQRQALFWRSIATIIYNPVLGIGMGNFHIVSIHELVSHNAYTQVAAEMGLAALVIYVMFIITPLSRLRRIEHETFGNPPGSRFYYLAVGLQASLIGYMVSSFFASVAYQWYIYYLVGYAVCLRRMYEAGPGAMAEEGAISAVGWQAAENGES